MKTAGMFVVAVAMLMWVKAMDETSGSGDNIAICPPLISELRNGTCVFVNSKVRDKIRAALNRRDFIVPNQVCPYCSSGVYDAYPDWDNCTQFKYCLDGRVTILSCQDLGGMVFNPALKACEQNRTTNNMCLNRNVNLLGLMVR
ncbi:uncharacterized protein LOC143280180 [Babylonia areolata]|uniref:uncharacterized protein LOC143280180 n=1 Tax=Babylonia areolata TaxID=304850 RepID=UPI003FD0DC20